MSDSKLSYSKKAKCQGCKALKLSVVDGKEVYSCTLGIGVAFTISGLVALRPRPMQKCWKPKTDFAYRTVKATKTPKITTTK